MEPILNFVAEIALWGSIALFFWGGMFTLQRLFHPERKRPRSPHAAGRGEPAAPGRGASLAN